MSNQKSFYNWTLLEFNFESDLIGHMPISLNWISDSSKIFDESVLVNNLYMIRLTEFNESGQNTFSVNLNFSEISIWTFDLWNVFEKNEFWFL